MRELRTKPWVLTQVAFVTYQFFQKGLPLEELMDTLMADTHPEMSSFSLDDISLWSLEVEDSGETRM